MTKSNLEPMQYHSDPTLERSFKGHKDSVTSLSFKPSLTQLASGSLDSTVMVWNFKPGMRTFRFIGHKAPVTCVDFSPSGNILASTSRDKTVRLWTPTVKGEVSVFTAHTAAVRGVQFSLDGRHLLTCSDDKSIKIWSSTRPKFMHNFTGHLNWVRSAIFSPDTSLVISGSDDKTVKVWDMNSKTCIQTYLTQSMCFQVSMPSFGLTHLIGGLISDGSIKVWDLRMHQLIQHYPNAHEGHSVTSIDLTSSLMFSTGGDGLVKVWDLQKGYLLYTLHGHSMTTTACTSSSNLDYFASASQDGQIFVWKSNFQGDDEEGVIPREVVVGSSSTYQEEKTLNLGPPTFSETKHIQFLNRPKTKTPDPPIISSPLTAKELPMNLSVTLETIISQLDVLTATMNIIERRLSLCEDRLTEMKTFHTQIPSPPPSATTMNTIKEYSTSSSTSSSS